MYAYCKRKQFIEKILKYCSREMKILNAFNVSVAVSEIGLASCVGPTRSKDRIPLVKLVMVSSEGILILEHRVHFFKPHLCKSRHRPTMDPFKVTFQVCFK